MVFSRRKFGFLFIFVHKPGDTGLFYPFFALSALRPVQFVFRFPSVPDSLGTFLFSKVRELLFLMVLCCQMRWHVLITLQKV